MNKRFNIQWFRKYVINDIFKNAGILFSGSFISHILLFLGSIPILRMYGPEIYGQYATLLAINGILTIPSTGQIHHGFFLEEDEVEINKLVSLIFLFFICTTILGLVGLLFYNGLVKEVPIQYYFVIPLFQFLGTFQIVVTTFIIKAKQFKLISIYKVIQATIYVLVVLLVGWIKPDLNGLILGYALSIIISIIYVRISTVSLNPILAMKMQWAFSIKKEYKKYIQFTLPGELVNATMSQIPLLWVNHFFGSINAGYFKFATKILSIPVDLMANSLGTFYKSQASDELKKMGHARDSFKNTFVLLFISGLILFILIYISIDTVLPIIWGHKWSTAGIFIKSLLVIYFFKYSIGPLTYIAQLTSKQKEVLIINSVVACSILVGFVISYYFNWALIPTLWTYTLFFCTSSLLSLFYSRKFSQ